MAPELAVPAAEAPRVEQWRVAEVEEEAAAAAEVAVAAEAAAQAAPVEGQGVQREVAGPAVAAGQGAGEPQRPDLTVEFLEENVSGAFPGGLPNTPTRAPRASVPCRAAPATHHSQLMAGSNLALFAAICCRGTLIPRCRRLPPSWAWASRH
jgi:hypothetical protein